MARTQITVKKRLKVKEAPEGEAPVAQGGIATVAEVVSEGKPASYTWAAIVGLVAVLLFVALILLQVTEYNALKFSFPVYGIN